jgi:hypothetical protein
LSTRCCLKAISCCWFVPFIPMHFAFKCTLLGLGRAGLGLHYPSS